MTDDAASGIDGLDEITLGGFARLRTHLIEGEPGSGKTTLAMQFLIAGARAGERGLMLSLTENESELRDVAAAHGWSLDGVEIVHLLPPETLIDEAARQTLLYSADLELGEVAERIFSNIRRSRARRIVIDSLSEIRLLAQGALRYRRQLLALKYVCTEVGATLLLLDDLTVDSGDKAAHSLTQSVLRLEDIPSQYGVGRRRLRLAKYRGRSFRAGYHDLVIRTGGMAVFPRLVAADHGTPFRHELRSTGMPQLDALLSGGLHTRTSTMILGPSGAGKTLLAAQILAEAARRGERSAMFAFDEEIGLLRTQLSGIGIDLPAMEAAGTLQIQQVDPAELSAGEFAHQVRELVEHGGVRALLLDSLNGYRAAMPDDQFLLLHMHELLTYLNRSGCLTLLTVVQHGLIGEVGASVDLTYLSDTVILLRYFEARGRVERAISVVKKRAGAHETAISALRVGSGGITIGEPITNFRGVLGGVPEFVDEGEAAGPGPG